jgi:hypothetical protein
MAELMSSWQDEAADRAEQKPRGIHTDGEKGGRVAGTRSGGIGLGGILVILGIVLAIVWSFWWGLIIGLVGLIFFGGFAKGRWY